MTTSAFRPDPVPVPPATREMVPARWHRPIHRLVNVVVSVAAVAATLVLAPLTLVGLTIAAVSAASLEVLWPLRARRRSRRALVTDLTHAVGNRYLVLPLMAGLLALVAPASSWLVPDGVVVSVHAMPWWAQLLVVFTLSDLCNYAGHRALHQVPWLWRLHAVHHSSEHLDWLATSRVHPLDLAFNTVVAAVPFYALGYAQHHPLLVTVLFLYPFYSHANARLPLPVLDRVLVSPAFHHWHHAEEPAAHDKNFGAILSVWDRLFGTAYQPDRYPARYGIGDPALDASDYAGHLLAPVTRRRSSPS